MTAYKYREGVSTRLLVAKETLNNPLRNKLPLIIINLDGTIGYFDEHKIYFVRQHALTCLVALSSNFQIAAFCTGQTKRCVRRLC